MPSPNRLPSSGPFTFTISPVQRRIDALSFATALAMAVVTHLFMPFSSHGRCGFHKYSARPSPAIAITSGSPWQAKQKLPDNATNKIGAFLRIRLYRLKIENQTRQQMGN